MPIDKFGVHVLGHTLADCYKLDEDAYWRVTVGEGVLTDVSAFMAEGLSRGYRFVVDEAPLTNGHVIVRVPTNFRDYVRSVLEDLNECRDEIIEIPCSGNTNSERSTIYKIACDMGMKVKVKHKGYFYRVSFNEESGGNNKPSWVGKLIKSQFIAIDIPNNTEKSNFIQKVYRYARSNKLSFTVEQGQGHEQIHIRANGPIEANRSKMSIVRAWIDSIEYDEAIDVPDDIISTMDEAYFRTVLNKLEGDLSYKARKVTKHSVRLLVQSGNTSLFYKGEVVLTLPGEKLTPRQKMLCNLKLKPHGVTL